jgi:small conductance mechanosensitive channel
MFAETRPGWVEQLDEWHLLTASKVALILILAFIATWLAHKAIRRSVRSMSSLRTTIAGRPGQRTEQRSRTITAVLRNLAGVLIWAVAIIAVLSLLGVNIAAFVAFSSIVAGALAFGAQQIVRDLLAGFFMFTEDQYGVGDDVDLGVAEGTVEEVSLRITRLRDADGKVWYVPHGQITRVANLSQEWALVVVDVPVARDADLDAAAVAIEAVAGAVEDDPSLRTELLERPRVLGVQEIRDDRVLLRLALRIKPASRLDGLRAVQALLVEATRDGRIPSPPPAGPTPVAIVGAPSGPPPGDERNG